MHDDKQGTPVFRVDIVETRAVTLRMSATILGGDQASARAEGESRARHLWAHGIHAGLGFEIGAALPDPAPVRDPVALARSYGAKLDEDDGAWHCTNAQGIGCSGATAHEAAARFCEQFKL